MPKEPLAEVVYVDFIGRETVNSPLELEPHGDYRSMKIDNKLSLRRAKERALPDFSEFSRGVVTVMSFYATATAQNSYAALHFAELRNMENTFTEEQWTDVFRVAARRIKAQQRTARN